MIIKRFTAKCPAININGNICLNNMAQGRAGYRLKK